ncbi:uncharacterized protein LAJ45_08796 [Morchella importuna]|uniref:uncharacterized protein n=1 Tax=Morchella importuna TaxID=1174673 RepID=UPI001E8CE543|nr:uncharacterized protein LAJ45_08796 [Morchella importuna]KAH8147318.1 hypothetical protein LAJ45_08796 [Morchella importuna]
MRISQWLSSSSSTTIYTAFPPSTPTLPLTRPTSTSTASPLNAFHEQFARPGDIISVLLLLGSVVMLGRDVIHQALAQLSGGFITPVAFSFGWITYAISALLAAIGANKLMPLPDATGFVVNSRSRYGRENRSWILGRIIRDYVFWCDPRIAVEEDRFLKAEAERRSKLPAGEEQKWNKYPPRIGLSISVYEASRTKTAGVPDKDWVYYTGILCALVQLGIAAVPWGLWGDWSIVLMTGCGTVLAFASGALPHWKAEKWSCRKKSGKTVSLTAGNGTKHQNPWFLLLIGVLGMAQNVIVCAAPRTPGAFGVHLEFKEAIARDKVMKALMDLENKYPYVGRSLVDTYFPGSNLRPDEEKFWKEAKVRAEEALKRRED